MKKARKIILWILLAAWVIGGTCVGYDDELREDIKGVVKKVVDTLTNEWDDGVWDESKWGE
jgi:hypothetical protein